MNLLYIIVQRGGKPHLCVKRPKYAVGLWTLVRPVCFYLDCSYKENFEMRKSVIVVWMLDSFAAANDCTQGACCTGNNDRCEINL